MKILYMIIAVFLISLVFGKKLLEHSNINKSHSRRILVFILALTGALLFETILLLASNLFVKDIGALSFEELFEARIGTVWIYTVPLSALAFLLGLLDSRKLILNRTQRIMPITILKGFLLGFCFPIIIVLIALAPMAYAGIPFHVEATHWTFGEWLEFFRFVLKLSFASGGLGAFTGVFSGLYNRLMLKYIFHL
ncbi:MAG: hypothetical protein ACLPSL_00050 [Smithella sp.]